MSALLPLDAALGPYSLTARQGRALIRCGKLPATKVGRAYLVSPHDVATLLRPTLRDVEHTPRARESENARAARQLREAGIDT